MSNTFDFEAFKAQAIEQLKAGVYNVLALTLVYLAFTRIRKKWTQPVQNWGQTARQLAILFPDRFKLIG